jgi:electron transport complex protein RnfA
MLVKLAAIFFSMILVNNYVLVKFYGICPFLGVSKKLDSSIGMSGAVIFVMLVATAVTFPIQIFVLNPADLGYLQTIVFILVIAVLVQFIEIFLKKYVVALYNSLGVYLPLITTNCCVLAVTILVVDDYGADVATLGFAAAYIEALVCAVGAGVGFMLAMVMFSGVRKRVEGTLQGPAHHPDRSSHHQPVLYGLRRPRRKPVQRDAVREEQDYEYCICCDPLYHRGRDRCRCSGAGRKVHGG